MPGFCSAEDLTDELYSEYSIKSVFLGLAERCKPVIDMKENYNDD